MDTPSANTAFADSLFVRGSALKSPGTLPFSAVGCSPPDAGAGLERLSDSQFSPWLFT
jgi:hypothetical protein